MGSPFPGVDPYLEDQNFWPDFHPRFLNYWCEALSAALPAHYDARIDERVQIVELDQEGNPFRPDIAVSRAAGHETAGMGSAGHSPQVEAGGVALMQPETVPLPATEEIKESSIHILHRPDRTLVAVLELLSPSNKINPGRLRYLWKRSDLLLQDVHLVELDLLLAGDRLPMGKPLPPADFYAIIARSDRRPNADVLRWTLRDPLPKIPIPLLKPDKDIVIDLAEVFAIAYERGRYARSVNYQSALSLPLGNDAVKWVAERIHSGK